MTTSFEDPAYLEACYDALATFFGGAKFAGGITLQSIKRVADIPDNIPVADQPCLFITGGPLHGEQMAQQLFGPAKWIFTAVCSIACRSDGSTLSPDPLPDSVANWIFWGLIKQLENTQPPYSKVTLGGLVYHTFVEGECIREIQNEQMFLHFPVYMIAGDVG